MSGIIVPKHMRYITQAIVCIATDLNNNAQFLQSKREAAGDFEAAKDGIGKVPKSLLLFGTAIGEIDKKYVQPNSRLIILGHGDPASTAILTAIKAGLMYTPEQLAKMVRVWLGGKKIRRISLHMCYGGGNRGDAAGTTANSAFFQAFKTRPDKSFAYKFASMVGDLAVDVTARTDITQMVRARNPETLGFMTAYRYVGDDGAERHKAFGDKFILVTNPTGTPANPINPSIRMPPARATA